MNARDAQPSDQPASPKLILHIAGSSSPDTPVEQWIAQAGLESVRCPDVYVGLARALHNLPGLCGVIVDTDNLSISEFEFFAILSRTRRELALLVHGSRHPDRVVRALESGARGLATREALVALAGAMNRRSSPSTLPVAAPASAEAAPSSARQAPDVVPATAPQIPAIVTPVRAPIEPHPPAQQPVQEQAEVSLEDTPSGEPSSDSSEGDSAAAASEARVPWLRYTGGPVRQAPGEAARPVRERVRPAAAPAVESAPASTPKPPDEFISPTVLKAACSPREYEPLLTEQELAALLGDDLADVALQERELLTGDGEVPGGGTR